MKNTGQTVGQRLAAAREKLDLTQEELAKRSRVPRNTIQNIEYDKVSPRLENLVALAAAAEVSIAELAGEKKSIPRELLARVIESADFEDPLRVAALLLEQFAAAPPRLRAVVLAYLFQDFEVMRKYQREIAALMPSPK